MLIETAGGIHDLNSIYLWPICWLWPCRVFAASTGKNGMLENVEILIFLVENANEMKKLYTSLSIK